MINAHESYVENDPRNYFMINVHESYVENDPKNDFMINAHESYVENDPRNEFMINVHESYMYVAELGSDLWPPDLLSDKLLTALQNTAYFSTKSYVEDNH